MSELAQKLSRRRKLNGEETPQKAGTATDKKTPATKRKGKNKASSAAAASSLSGAPAAATADDNLPPEENEGVAGECAAGTEADEGARCGAEAADAAEEPPAAAEVEDESQAATKEATAAVEETPAPAEETPAPAEETPAASMEETPAPAVETPAASVEETPAPAEETPAASVEETPAPAEETPAASVEETPAPAEETPATAEETPAPAEETPATAEETPAPAEETPATGEETPAPAVETPATAEVASKEGEGDAATPAAAAQTDSELAAIAAAASAAGKAAGEKANKEREEYVKSCLEKAVACKAEGGVEFKQGHFEAAKAKYSQALGYAQAIEEGLNNRNKADVFELCVPCHTNVALCSIKLKEYADAVIFAKNSLLLINALGSRISSSEIWKILLVRGWTEAKLLRDMKKKSLFLLGKAELLNHNYDKAVESLQEALNVISNWTDKSETTTSPAPGDASVSAVSRESSSGSAVDSLSPPTSPARPSSTSPAPTPAGSSKEVDEIRDLLAKAKAKLASTAKKEKSMWSKAFQENTAKGAAESAAVASVLQDTKNIKVDLSKLGISSGSVLSSKPASSGSLSAMGAPAAANPAKKPVSAPVRAAAAAKAEGEEEEEDEEDGRLVAADAWWAQSMWPALLAGALGVFGLAGVLSWRLGWFGRSRR